MKKLLTAFGMCLSMFLAIPMPRFKWDDGLRRLSTACLPVVGLVIGGFWLAAAYLARWLLPEFLAGAVIAGTPFLLTGFIHLDGFMDTGDAILSWRDREEKLRILKDVHVGSFSVVLLVLLMLFQYAACMDMEKLLPLLLIPVLSRCGSAFCVLKLKTLGHSEYAAANDVPPSVTGSVIAMAAAALLAMTMMAGWKGLAVGFAVLLGYGLAMWRCVRTLGGVSGDLAGFSLTVSELCGLIALAAI